jgi:SAM-dependent methyltransferase
LFAFLKRLYVAREAKTGGSEAYWKRRYEVGGDSGSGSSGEPAVFKAEFLNGFVAEHQVGSVIEFGCGDGRQLELAQYPRYVGLDVSERAVAMCRERFASDSAKSFGLLADYSGERADLSLSLDVIYHLIEDEIFDAHLRTVFAAATGFVVVYSSNTDVRRTLQRKHVRNRKFTDCVSEHAPDWGLVEVVAGPVDQNTDTAVSFHVFAPLERGPAG